MSATSEPVADALEALSAYGLPIGGVRRLAGGNMTSVWLVTAREGRYVLRRLAAGSERQARTRHHLLRFLAERLEGVPAPVAALTGDTLVQGVQGPHELLTYVPGTVPRSPDGYDFGDDALLASAGRYLGRLHRVLATYVPPAGAAWFRPHPETLDWDAVARRLRRDRRPEATVLIDLLDGFAVRVERLRSVPPAGAGGAPAPDEHCAASARHGGDACGGAHQPRHAHVIHNDFGWYNAVLRRRRVVGVIDFDGAVVGRPVEDVAWTALTFVPVDADRPPDRMAERLRLLLAAYEREAPLRRAERAALPGAMALRQAQMAMGILRACVEGDTRYDGVFSHAPGYVEGLRRYEDEGVAARLAAAIT